MSAGGFSPGCFEAARARRITTRHQCFSGGGDLIVHRALVDEAGGFAGLLAPRQESAAPIIRLVCDGGLQWEEYITQVREWLPDLAVGSSGGHYIYEPESPHAAVPPDQLASAALALSHQDLDFVVFSRALAAPPGIACRGGLRNSLVVRSGMEHGQPMRGRVLRLRHDASLPLTTLPEHLGIGFDHPDHREPRPHFDRDYHLRPSALPLRLEPAGKSAKPVVFILPAQFAVGGVERVVIDLMRRLRDQFDFVVMTVEPVYEHLGSLETAAADLALAFYHLGEILPADRFLDAMDQLRECYRPALVYVPNSSPWQCRHSLEIREVFANLPLVDQTVYDTEIGWIAHMNDPGMRAADRFIAVNTRVRDTLAGRYQLPAHRIDTIYPSIDPDRFAGFRITPESRRAARQSLGLPADGPVYGWVGRMTIQKRPLEFLEVARGAPGHFLMVGDGELASAADEFIRRRRLTNVTRKPFIDDMAMAFAAMDGLLITSQYEGLPCVMLEAMAFGIPVLSTDVGDVGLVLDQYGSGRVVKELGGFGGAFAEWHRDRQEWARRAQESASSIRERFGGPAIARQYLRSFRRAIAEFRAAAR
jgi:glycosyltransferase involved in cell wall biosynthesis